MLQIENPIHTSTHSPWTASRPRSITWIRCWL